LKEFFRVMGKRDGVISFAFSLHAVGPHAIGQVHPVVFNRLQLLRSFLKTLSPMGQEEELIEGTCGDEHAVVEVG